MRLPQRWLPALSAVVCCWCAVAAAEVTARRDGENVVLQIDGQPFATYVARSGAKPIVWPILGPTGAAVTRAFPMQNPPGEKQDHPHHRSLWFTHGLVNGINFWDEKEKHGTIEHREYVRVEGGPAATIVTRNDWIAPNNGPKQLEDVRTLTFGGTPELRWIDFHIRLTASAGAVVFGDTKEGAFGMRVAETMRVDANRGGRIVNSNGQTDKDAWAKRASWVDYHGPLGDATVGIAILNHPQSFRYPTYWHVRTYGLYAANPFGLRDFINQKNADGSYRLEPGKSLALRYRVLLHRGDDKQARVAEAFAAYADTPAIP